MSAFLFLRKLADGPATEVYVAHVPGLEGRYAVELLRPELVDQPEVVGRFLGEAELRLRVSKPRSLAWVATGCTPEGRPFVRSEAMPAECLRTRLLKKGPLELTEAIALGRFVVEALRERGHPHGKLYPEGLLLGDLDSLEPKKLLDFGLSLATTSSGRQPAWLPAEYRAPEVLAGHRHTEQSDIYGVGLLLWEALTGSSPVRGLTPDETQQRQLEREAPRLPNRVAPLGPLVARCLAKRPEDRFPTLGELEAALVAAQAVEELREKQRHFDDESELPEAVETELAPPSPPLASWRAVHRRLPLTPVHTRSFAGRLLTLAFCSSLLWATAAVPRHRAPLDAAAPSLPAREPLSLERYAASCGDEPKDAPSLALRPSTERLLWAEAAREPELKAQRGAGCAWRSDWLTGKHGRGHRRPGRHTRLSSR